MNVEVSCSFQIDRPALSDVAEAVGLLLAFLRDQGVEDQMFLDELELAATEGINNAIEHGCRGIRDPLVKVTLSIMSLEVRLEIADPSDFKGWTGSAVLPEDPFAEGGRGRFLIEQLTTGVESDRRGGMYVMALRKKFTKAPWNWDPRRQERILDAMTEEVGASYEVNNALIGLGELLASAREISVFLMRALERVCQLTGADAAFVRMARPAGLVLAGKVGPFARELAPVIAPASPGVEAQVFATGEEVTVVSSASLELSDPLFGHVQAAFVAPIPFKSECRGVLVVAQQDSSQAFFSAVQLQVVRVVAEYLGIVSVMSELQSRREMEQRQLRELEIAAEIQMSLMPQQFDLSERFDIYGRCVPALQAGGDYFDLIALQEGGIFVVIADVMGKGISAALLANMLRTHIRAKLELALDPGAVLTAVNRAMTPDLAKLEMFITVTCGWIAPNGDEIRMASAGHPAGILYNGEGSLEDLESQGLPVGLLDDVEYETCRNKIAIHDTLLFFTDGIPEARDDRGRMFDMAGMKLEIAKARPASAKEIVERVLRSASDFSNHGPPTDDRTLVAIIRKR